MFAAEKPSVGDAMDIPAGEEAANDGSAGAQAIKDSITTEQARVSDLPD
jgi:hypothetical protein